MESLPTNPLPPEDSARTVPFKSASKHCAPLPPIPGYELQEEVGRGGMGVVYRARQKGLNRIVALKVILAGAHAGPRALVRFRTEAEVLARLEHTNIVQIHEVGESGGLPFYSMEFCGEGSLSDRLTGTPLPAREAAELIETLARAIHAAHEAGIVHRDLKPANILLQRNRTQSRKAAMTKDTQERPESGNGSEGPRQASFSSTSFRLSEFASLREMCPKITDFGVAKQLEEESDLTRTGVVLGTPEYMAPEQAIGLTKQVGPAADIYSLGAILYECLTGRPPFCAATGIETIALVKSSEPVWPLRLQPGTPRDLNTICLKCLHKEPARRYLSAAALADDMKHFLEGEPIRARPASLLERGLKWMRRRPAIAALLAVIVVLLVAGIGGITWAYREAVRERREAVLQRDHAEKERGNALRQQENAEHSLGMKTLLAAQASWREPNAAAARRQLEDVPEPRRGWEWGVLRRQFEGGLFTMYGHTGAVIALALRGDGQLLASVDDANVLIHWDMRTGRLLRRLELKDLPLITHLASSPDGRTLALAHVSTREKPGGVILWDVQRSQIIRRVYLDAGGAACVAFSPDGKQLAAGPARQVGKPTLAADILLWEVDTGKRLRALAGHRRGVNRLVYRPDGKVLASAGADWIVRIWDLEGNRPPRAILVHLQDLADPGEQHLGVRGLAFHPDGHRLASAGYGDVHIWDLATGREVGRARGDSQGVNHLAFSPDGRDLVVTGAGGLVQLTSTNRHIRTFPGHTGEGSALAYLADGHHVVSAGQDGTLRVMDTRLRSSGPSLTGPRQKIDALSFARDSRRVHVVAGSDLWTWDSFTGRVEWTRSDPDKLLLSLAVSADGSLIGTGNSGGVVQLRDAGSGQVLRELSGHRADVLSLAFSPDGKVLAAASSDQRGGEVRLWDVPAGKMIRTHEVPAAAPGSVPGQIAIDPTGRQVALAISEGQIRRWDLLDGRELTPLRNPSGSSFGLAFSPDGRFVASGGLARSVTLWETDTGQIRHVLRGHGQTVTSVAFTPDSRRLATSSIDNLVRIWDVRDGQLLATLPAIQHAVRSLDFSPDGRTLAAACWSAGRPAVLLWDAGPLKAECMLRGHQGPVLAAIYSPDGRLLASSATDNTICIWEAAGGRLLHRIETDTSSGVLFFTRDGKHVLTSPAGKTAWEAETGRQLDGVLKNFRAAVVGRRSPDGRFMAVIEGDLIRLVRLQGDECEEGRRRLVLQEDMAWHTDEAARLERLNQPFAAAFHLDRLLRLSPWDAGLWLRHGRACAGSGQNDRAAFPFLRAILLNPRLVP